MTNGLLLLLSLGLFLLELALRGEVIDRFYRSRSYEVNGYEFHYHAAGDQFVADFLYKNLSHSKILAGKPLP